MHPPPDHHALDAVEHEFAYAVFGAGVLELDQAVVHDDETGPADQAAGAEGGAHRYLPQT